MSRIIAIANQKGGVGKTTTAINLSSCLAEKGKKVLVIDMDPQGNTTSGLGIDKNELENTIYEMIIGECLLEECLLENVFNNLSLIPSNVNLSGAEIELMDIEGKEYIVRGQVNTIRDNYDFVIIDCPPDENFLNNCVYAASDALIVPVTTDRYSVEGILELSNCIDAIKFLNSDLHLAGILMTKIKRNTQVEREAMLDAEDCAKYLNTKVFSSTISLSTIIEKAQRNYQSLMQYAPTSKITREYMQFVNELLIG